MGCEERQEKQHREEQSSLWHQKLKVFVALESTDVFKEKQIKKQIEEN